MDGTRVNPSGHYMQKYAAERMGDTKLTCLEDVEKLLALHDCQVDKPYILFLVFDIGYRKLLGKVAAAKWPFKLQGIEFRKRYDLAVFVHGAMGKMITLHTRTMGLPR